MRITTFQAILWSVALCGCFTHLDEIQSRSPVGWSNRECLTVMVANMRHNLYDPAVNVQTIVTPFFPSVIEAISRLRQSDLAADSDAIRPWHNALLKSGIGLYIDWEREEKLVNAYGNYYRGPQDLDSILFLVTLRNKSWPCNVPVQNVLQPAGYYVSQPIASFSDWPCYIPEISDIGKRIFLVNQAGDSLRAEFVWGRRNNQLTMEENLFVMFNFREHQGVNFFEAGPSVKFVITGFDLPTSFDFSFSDIKG